jgi:hypothetical protein
LLVAPFLYMAVQLNITVNANPNKGTHSYPQFTDLWIVIAGGLVCYIWEEVTFALSYKFVY